MIIRESIVSISLSDLRSIGLFDKSNQFKTLPVVIRKNNETYHLNVSLEMSGDGTYIRFNYTVNGKDVDYQIPLVQVPNPITGKYSYYMQCTVSSKKSRKLFLNGLYFQHSSTICKMYYFHDTLPVSMRGKYRQMKNIHTLEQSIADRTKRYYKTHYAGVLTFKHRKVMAAFKELNKIV